MQEQKYGKTDLNRKQINTGFFCIAWRLKFRLRASENSLNVFGLVAAAGR
jgi:hypothetical protein